MCIYIQHPNCQHVHWNTDIFKALFFHLSRSFALFCIFFSLPCLPTLFYHHPSTSSTHWCHVLSGQRFSFGSCEEGGGSGRLTWCLPWLTAQLSFGICVTRSISIAANNERRYIFIVAEKKRKYKKSTEIRRKCWPIWFPWVVLHLKLYVYMAKWNSVRQIWTTPWFTDEELVSWFLYIIMTLC